MELLQMSKERGRSRCMGGKKEMGNNKDVLSFQPDGDNAAIRHVHSAVCGDGGKL
jgi:hypothetical protein